MLDQRRQDLHLLLQGERAGAAVEQVVAANVDRVFIVTAVPDDLMAVAVLVIEAQRHAVERRDI